MSNSKVKWKMLNRKQKMEYIWDYYKWFILSGIALLIFLIYFLNSIMRTQEETYLNIEMINTNAILVNESNYFDDFKAVYCDSQDAKLGFETNYSVQTDGHGGGNSSVAYQVLSAEFLCGEIDVFISDRTTYEYMMQNEYFLNMEDALSKEELTKLKDYLIYAKDENGETYPAGISLRDCDAFNKENFYTEEAVIGIGALSENTEEAVEMIRYLFEK